MAPQKGHKFNVDRENEGGRPAKYDDKFIEAEADALLEWVENDKFIWFEKFCLSRRYDPNLMSLWAEKNEKFKHAYNLARAHQKVRLIEGGLIKKLQFNMVQLLLGHEFGIFAKQETKLTGDAVNPLTLLLESIDGKTKDLVKEESAEHE